MTSPKLILLAEDSPDDEAFFRSVLKASGFDHRVIVVRDGVQAIAYLSGIGPFSDRDQFPLPDVFMVDVKMPHKDGFEVMEWVKGQPHLASILVIAITGSGRIEDLQRAYLNGAKSFIAKPCTVPALRNLADAYPQYWTVIAALALIR